MDEDRSSSARLPPGWTESFSAEHNRPYWFHEASGESTWERPTPPAGAAAPAAAAPAAAAPAAAAAKPRPPAYSHKVSAAAGGSGGPADGGAPSFAHVDPEGRQNPYSAEANALIEQARRAGHAAVRVPGVVLPNGRTLQFEVRFGQGAVSRKFRTPPASGLLQVNVATEDSRVVVELQPRGNKPNAHRHRGGGGGLGHAWEIEGPDGTWAEISPVDNAALEKAKHAGKFIVQLPSGLEVDLACQPNPQTVMTTTAYFHTNPSGELEPVSATGLVQGSFCTALVGGVTHPAPSKYHDENFLLAFIHTKSGEPIVIMVFRCAIQKVLCLTPPVLVFNLAPCECPHD
jgi:hypothetical protein